MVFTADEFGEGAEEVLTTFEKLDVKASFFLTGKYYADLENKRQLERMRRDGHYLGAHSDQHLLYCDWTNRDSLLVTRDEFDSDLDMNYQRMAGLGVSKEEALFFMPPYEWYNATIREWTEDKGLNLINFTPGLRTAADYTYPEMGQNRYLTSDWIYEHLVKYERSNASGLNGFVVLVHLGTDPRRPDKFYSLLPQLIEYLRDRGYTFKRVDQLLHE